MVSIEALSIGTLALAMLAVGYVMAFRADRALAVQERYAERVSWRPPSEDPEYYEATRSHRAWVLRLGGGVLLVVGSLLFAVSVYATVFVDSFPQ